MAVVAENSRISTPQVPRNPRSQASLVSSIRKWKYYDSTAVHRRILASIWRLFCKWNSSATVAALHAARQQAYSAKEVATSGQQHSGSVLSSASSSSACVSPCDGSPQVTYHSL